MLRVFKWVLLLWWSARVRSRPARVVAFADRPEVENRLLEERRNSCCPV